MMTLLQKRKTEKWIVFFLWLILILWRIPFLNKGIDYMDTGFTLQNYKQAFTGSGIQNIGTFFTTLIGGLIYQALPAYHLLVMRALHWLIGLLTMTITYHLFKSVLNRVLMLVLLLGISIANISGEALLSYYPLTSLFLMGSVYLLHQGLTKDKLWALLLSGVIAGVNVFIRLPNLFFLAIVVCVPWYGFYHGDVRRKTIVNTAVFAAGVVLALLCSIAVMAAVMGLEEVSRSFTQYVRGGLGLTGNGVVNTLGIEERSGHSITAEILSIGYQGVQTIAVLLVFFVPLLVGGRWILKQGENRGEKITFVFRAATAAVWIAASVLLRNQLNNRVLFLLGLTSMVICLAAGIGYRRKNTELSLLCLLNVILSFFVIWGTDLGLNRFSVVRPLQVLAFMYCIRTFANDSWEFSWKRIKLTAYGVSHTLVYLTVLLMTTIYITGVLCVMPKTYLDAPISALDASVSNDIPELKGMRTSKIRADEIEQYWELAGGEALLDKELAIFGFFPLGFVIGDQGNYFAKVSPCVDWPSNSVESLLSVIRDKEAQGIVPVIVVSKVNVLQIGGEITTEAKEAVLAYMLSLHNFDIYAETAYFTIYVAGNSYPETDL